MVGFAGLPTSHSQGWHWNTHGALWPKEIREKSDPQIAMILQFWSWICHDLPGLLQQSLTCNVLILSEDRRFCQTNTVTWLADQFPLQGALRLYPYHSSTSSDAGESLLSCTGVVPKAQAVNMAVTPPATFPYSPTQSQVLDHRRHPGVTRVFLLQVLQKLRTCSANFDFWSSKTWPQAELAS